MAKKIIFIHGRSIKPPESDLQELWYAAVRHGLQRDFGVAGVAKFESIKKEFVYYGKLSNDFLHEKTGVEIPDDIESRQEAFETLKTYQRSDFNKTTYKKLAKNSFLKEALADTFSGALSMIRAGTPLISVVAPDMAHYWNQEEYFGSDIRLRLTDVLKKAFDNNDEIMLVSHSLGTIISYDNLWKFSHYGEYRRDYGANKKIELFVTMGSPLGDENAKQHLKGKESSGKLKYPLNIKRWINISAEDDYISHDSRLKNDFSEMYRAGLLEQPVKDIYPVYNLTVRNESPNPHSAIGYLVNPKFIDVLSEWMYS